MDWKSFIVQMTQALAWPFVFLSTAIIFRNKLGELLPRLKKLKHKDTELEFEQAIKELVLDRDIQDENAVKVKENLKTDSDFNFLMRLADLSPRVAVQEAFRILENSAYNAVARTQPEIYASGIRKPYELLKMLRGEVLTPQQYHEFNELKKLRNSAAHSDDFDLRGMPIEAYIDIAMTLARRLDEYKP